MNVSLGEGHSSVELSREDRVEASIGSHVEWMSDEKEKMPKRERLVSPLLSHLSEMIQTCFQGLTSALDTSLDRRKFYWRISTSNVVSFSSSSPWLKRSRGNSELTHSDKSIEILST